MAWKEVLKRRRKNPHAVALGRLGGLVRSEAKRRANRENGRKGGLVKRGIAARPVARRPRPSHTCISANPTFSQRTSV
jgi:hypothetical protein